MKFLESIWNLLVTFFESSDILVNAVRYAGAQLGSISRWIDEADDIIRLSDIFMPPIVYAALGSLFTIYVTLRLFRFMTFQAG